VHGKNREFWSMFSYFLVWASFFIIAAIWALINKGKSTPVAVLILLLNLFGIFYAVILYLAINIEC